MAEIIELQNGQDIIQAVRKHLLAVVAEMKRKLQQQSLSSLKDKYQYIVVLDKLRLALSRRQIKRHELDEVLGYLLVLNSELNYVDSLTEINSFSSYG